MAHRIARVVWFDIYGEADWHEGDPAKLYKVEAIGRVWEEETEGIPFLVGALIWSGVCLPCSATRGR